MADRDEVLDALYQEGLQRWQTWVALCNRLAEERGSSRRFYGDFAHLISRPVAPQAAHHHEVVAPPPEASLPPEKTQDEVDAETREYWDAVKRWEETTGKVWHGRYTGE